ncbi:SDR family NAD(P)-dependent oxidoreductase [Sphingobium tyrosinilyticum]|uniref:SDR family NAD(P)-dependent oxidoreductase n=1 Tax=Sphingobium tyrosinilyticum TaxID=2715436 RepID=A0ABV9F1G1_9SPHN
MQEPSAFDLKGRVAVITGAGQGVGRAIALILARHGAGGIVVNDFFADRAEAVAQEVRAIGVRAFAMVGDVTQIDQIREGHAEAEAALGPVSILVNNAGNAGPAGFPHDLPPFWETDPARWRRFADVNLFGVMNCCHVALPGMVERRYGRVVTIISDSARMLDARTADYAAAKAGAAGFMRGLAADAARYGVTCNNIAIATMRTIIGDADSEASKRQLSRYAIRRYGTPDDVAGTALLLCSDAASWITGQTYPVDGGYSCSL